MSKCSVETRANSIRLRFTLDGVPQRPTLRDDDTGKPLPPTANNIKYAGRLAEEIERKMGTGTFNVGEYFSDLGGDVTLAAHLDTWFGTVQRLAPSTLKSYGSAVNFWKAALGGKSLRAVTVTDLRTALSDRPELNGKTVNNYVSVANKAFALALVDNLIGRNVVAEVPRATWQKKPPDPFTRGEAEAIIAELRASAPPTVANMVEWWMFTGVRTGEAFGLQWVNVDFKQSSMLVCESIVLGEERDSTKTGVARHVALNSRAMAAVRRQLEVNQDGADRVWLNPATGDGWTDERAFRHTYWEPTLARLGIRYRRPYCCRHTYATMMLMAGRTPAWCAKQLGHSIEMFLGTYSKWIDGDQDVREVAGLEAWLEEGVTT